MNKREKKKNHNHKFYYISTENNTQKKKKMLKLTIVFPLFLFFKDSQTSQSSNTDDRVKIKQKLLSETEKFY